jgi:hypothetical protein
MPGYYIRRGDKVAGPNSGEQLKLWAAEGKLLPEDELSESPAGPWHTVSRTNLVQKLPAQLVASKASVPAVVTQQDDKPQGPVFAILRASKATVKAAALPIVKLSNAMAVRSQRNHELKLAKISMLREQAIRDREQLARAPVVSPPPAPQANYQQPQAPVIVHTHVTQQINHSSGCAWIVLAVLVTFFVLLVIGSM